jgi:predicted aspartyl protease
LEGKMTIPYDLSFDPAAPVLLATLTGVVRSRPQMRLPALMDTGADMTAIPTTAVKRLHLYSVGRMAVEGIERVASSTNIYTVRLAVEGQPAREIEVVQTGQPFVILGRDWLERYYLLLNGPEKTMAFSETPIIEVT